MVGMRCLYELVWDGRRQMESKYWDEIRYDVMHAMVGCTDGQACGYNGDG